MHKKLTANIFPKVFYYKIQAEIFRQKSSISLNSPFFIPLKVTMTTTGLSQDYYFLEGLVVVVDSCRSLYKSYCPMLNSATGIVEEVG